MMNPVVVNADDLGLSREINEGILRGMEEGVIGDASLMSEAPHVDDALDKFKAFGVRHVGIHVNLDEQIGWSTRGRERFSRNELMSMLASEDFLAACRERVRFQIEKVMDSGLLPTHVDTHHHIHGFQPIFDLILGLMKEYGIPAMRFSIDGYTLTTREPIPFHAPLYRKMRESLEREQVFFCTSMKEGAGKISEISSFPSELVVHPSLGGELWRVGEMDMLLSDSFREVIHEHNIRIVGFKDLIDKGRIP